MKTKRTHRARLEKSLDALWREKVKEDGRCEVCGKREYLNAHHIVGRRNKVLRWDLRNGVSLCAGCHTFSTNSAHQNPIHFHNWLHDNRYDDLVYLQDRVKEPPRPIKIEELEEQYKKLKGEI